MGSLSIADVAAQSGLAPSALRYYESLGLISAQRDSLGHRCYSRLMLRRLGLIRLGRSLGLSLQHIGGELGHLPPHRAPTRAEWREISTRWDSLLRNEIAALTTARKSLSECTECGCLKPTSCTLLAA
ncbi:MerR family DNA-binding protein [Ornithinimicrobium cavernae]|uniref:MerR family DNA-binding protein n=1 Tax=Ornithinimicrobium cavernae TaxID=2666047 RepID=UPI00137AEDD5